MNIESRTINLSKNDELFQQFYVIVSFDGAEYAANFSCKLHDEDLARKLQKNRSGTFSAKVKGDEYCFLRYSPDNTIAWTTLVITNESPEALKAVIDEIALAVHKKVEEKNLELLKDIPKFNDIFK